MDYNIFSNIAPAMPKPSKGTEFVKFASKRLRVYTLPFIVKFLTFAP